MDIDKFKEDYFDNKPPSDICCKYGLSLYMYYKLIKGLAIKRKKYKNYNDLLGLSKDDDKDDDKNNSNKASDKGSKASDKGDKPKRNRKNPTNHKNNQTIPKKTKKNQDKEPSSPKSNNKCEVNKDDISNLSKTADKLNKDCNKK